MNSDVRRCAVESQLTCGANDKTSVKYLYQQSSIVIRRLP
jgi:hypothetical protein